jgi:hypothetical protein
MDFLSLSPSLSSISYDLMSNCSSVSLDTSDHNNRFSRRHNSLDGALMINQLNNFQKLKVYAYPDHSTHRRASLSDALGDDSTLNQDSFQPISSPLLHSSPGSPDPSSPSSTSKKKNQKCQNCGTSDTPLWRRSVDKKRLLCNACGKLKYSNEFM